MVDQIERLCQDCQQPLVLQQMDNTSAAANESRATTSLDVFDDKLALKDSQHFHDVIDV